MDTNSWGKHIVVTNLAQVTIMMFKTTQYFYKYLAFFTVWSFICFNFQQWMCHSSRSFIQKS